MGGFASVYRAVLKERPVAVKKLFIASGTEGIHKTYRVCIQVRNAEEITYIKI